ncbi:biotin--[acetyl-CoA-carboxylase] ligase [Rhizosaccharibacter radicis]|uniref:Biotin--[acetyl-CoA-carboxylase] ligase n=1 Tax=Rhizosaccharibacter radicis TaxID=2782605 RepID=A0ABT1VYI0_9PROT|nr:biotin--[acetyl-CoA-carboxylase] ligase [Acetobacteraceae bacterium KSS12]
MSGVAWRLQCHDSLPSTSDAVIEAAEAGEPAGLAILARRQTRGRGSRGRSWVEPPEGNLAVTVLLRPDDMLDVPAVWPFVAGLALHDALVEAAGIAERDVHRLILKWPNDIMLDGRKLAGILVERGVSDGVTAWLAIGFGANLVLAPSGPGISAAALTSLGVCCSPEHVAHRLLAALDKWQDALRDRGFGAIRSTWLERAHPVGTEIRCVVSGISRSGRFSGLAEDGALLLQDAGNLLRVDTGHILMPAEG